VQFQKEFWLVAMAKFKASAMGPVDRMAKADQRLDRPQPAAPASEAPSRRELIFGPAQPKWQHSNPRSEITVKPRSRVLWSRSS
jgi:hypothetical protein